MPRKPQPGSKAGRRLLIVEDREADAERLLRRDPIRLYTGSVDHVVVSNSAQLTMLASEAARSSVVIAQTAEAALELVRKQHFDLIISDLLMFAPTIVNAHSNPDYFNRLPLHDTPESPGRLSQILNPAGLEFIRRVRSGVSEQQTTPRTVPIIAMTFFWRHPRFDALYLRQLKAVGTSTVIGYLPKYYWIKNDKIERKGDTALGQLIRILSEAKGDVEQVSDLVELIFDAVALDLFVYKNRFDLHDALAALRASYHDSCRAVLDFTMIFNLGALTPGEGNVFNTITEQLRTGRQPGVEIDVRFANVPSGDRNKESVTGGRRLETRSEKFLTLDRGKRSVTADKANLRKFTICLALALFTYPLASEPHCLTNEELAKLVSSALGEEVPKETIRTDMNSIRADLQATLPADLEDFVSAKDHLLVTDGQRGYYLNGTYRLKWLEKET